MSRLGRANFDELKAIQKRMQKLSQSGINQFCEQCAKELAARLLRKAIKRTPVGQYTDGKVGGTLRHGWTAGSHRESELSSTFGGGTGASKYVNDLPIKKTGNTYEVEIINPVEYANYVEYGHRTRSHKGWVQGRFMLTISEDEIKNIAPKLLENKLNLFLKEIFNEQ